MFRRVGALVIGLVGACAAPVKEAPPPVHAEEPFAVWPPLMPSAVDLDMVPLGRWAEYEETYLGSVTIKERVALVGEGRRRATRSRRRPRCRRGDKTVFATVFAAGAEGGGQVVSNVFQVADDEPMQAPPIAPAEQPYPRVDPRKLVGVDTISMRVGTFRAQHYRDRTTYGEQVDFWIDDSVGPIGLIRAGSRAEAAPDDPRRLQVRAGGDGKRCRRADHQAGAAVRRRRC